MQAELQPYVDGAISKTITLGPESSPDEVKETLASAYDLGLKGCTVYRRSARAGVLSRQAPEVAQTTPGDAHCCEADRESD